MGVASDAQAKPEHDRGERSSPADLISPALAGAGFVGVRARSAVIPFRGLFKWCASEARLRRVAWADVKDLRRLKNRARVLRFSKPTPGLGWQASAMGERTKGLWVMERPCPQKIMGDRTGLSTGMGDITMRRRHLVRAGLP